MNLVMSEALGYILRQKGINKELSVRNVTKINIIGLAINGATNVSASNMVLGYAVVRLWKVPNCRFWSGTRPCFY